MSGSSSGVEPRRFHPIPAVLALAQAGWIWWLSSKTLAGPGGPWWSFYGNSFHFVLFGLLAILLAETLRTRGGWSTGTLVLLLVLTVAYGITDEVHQLWTPGRSADAKDVCVDFLGAVGALALWWGVRGPGRLKVALARAFAVGLVMLAFNAFRAWASTR